MILSLFALVIIAYLLIIIIIIDSKLKKFHWELHPYHQTSKLKLVYICPCFAIRRLISGSWAPDLDSSVITCRTTFLLNAILNKRIVFGGTQPPFVLQKIPGDAPCIIINKAPAS